jgi:diadenosine tetraphosphatase ApaH/serine/threonine PP2A family protein phosphatase
VRVLVLSDVHANLEATEACLEAAPPYDCAVDLGDVVGYGASPNEVVERIRSVCRLHIRGNHDKAAAGLTTLEGFNPIAAAAGEWTRQALTPAHVAWLRGLPEGPASLPGFDGVLLVHGSPRGEDEYLVDVQQAVEPLLYLQPSVTFFGHSHIQGGFFLEGDACSEINPPIEPGDRFDSGEVAIRAGAKYLINPGSVGQPRDGDWRAAFALYDSDRGVVTYYRAPYDVGRSQERIRAAGLPERLATRLAFGR